MTYYLNIFGVLLVVCGVFAMGLGIAEFVTPGAVMLGLGLLVGGIVVLIGTGLLPKPGIDD